MLVEPRDARNVGAVARAMRNFGAEQLVLVDDGSLDLDPAQITAVHAVEVLARLQRFASLDQALSPFSLVVGTTHRAGQQRGRLLAPRAAAPELLAAAGRAPLAILFGPEDRGLSTAELQRCSGGLRIPAAPAQPSFNLAQAVLLVLYELFHAWLDGRPAAPRARPPAAAPSPEALAHLRERLGRLGARPGDDAAPGGQPGRTLQELLRRAAPSRAEAAVLERLLARCADPVRRVRTGASAAVAETCSGSPATDPTPERDREPEPERR